MKLTICCYWRTTAVVSRGMYYIISCFSPRSISDVIANIHKRTGLLFVNKVKYVHVSSNASKLRGGCHVSRHWKHAVWTQIYMNSWCISNSALHFSVRNCWLQLLTLILPFTCDNSAELPAAHYQPLVIILSQFDSPPNHSTSRYSEENVSLSTREKGYFLEKFFRSSSAILQT